ncbi:UbiH/UbiF family hydroxylase [Ancylobacter amanitiformis]|uniref:2-octaprenyl-6-methoxyphenol hydroxylase n=1 Tax=Ancylobacter amanitiformis TaxID=217069 RepID=A0ABU0LQ67_9HYPH|nr:UbiH/UbiF family hydroxylase [Ancylobacter amanitiformis]MDQ0510842.1 2-octaprenyl-6-methoxyphenol hydroxylase [Ancylobacter amanitiformis]
MTSANPAGDTGIGSVAVIGAGASGLVAALAFAAAGLNVMLVAPRRAPDPRATALMDGSVMALRTLGVWDRLRPDAAPLRVMRLIDATQRLLRAPEVDFRAGELGLEAFAWNLENETLLAALDAAVADVPAIARLEASLLRITDAGDAVRLELDDGREVAVALVAAADGRNSPCRQAAGIELRAHDYPQVAVTATLAHTRAHGEVSTEFHTETGPFTLVPLPGNRSSIVCVVSPREAKELMALDEPGFARVMERKARSVLGAMRLDSPRGAFPLSARTAKSFARGRIALIGEAAHIIPPIGAQGLNLGIRDAATLAELAGAAAKAGEDIGGPGVSEAYERRRRADVESRSFAVDLFNRSLLTGFLPVAGMRGLGLWLLGRSPVLRRAVMRQGVGPTRDLPRLVAGKPL